MSKIAVRNFVIANTYEEFKDVVEQRVITPDELHAFADKLANAVAVELPSFPRAAVNRMVVDYFLSEFGASKLGASVNVDFKRHEVKENAWKKYARRRKAK